MANQLASEANLRAYKAFKQASIAYSSAQDAHALTVQTQQQSLKTQEQVEDEGKRQTLLEHNMQPRRLSPEIQRHIIDELGTSEDGQPISRPASVVLVTFVGDAEADRLARDLTAVVSEVGILLSTLKAKAKASAVEKLENAPSEWPFGHDGEMVTPETQASGADCLQWTSELDQALGSMNSRDRDFISLIRFCPSLQKAADTLGIRMDSLNDRIKRVGERLRLALLSQELLPTAP